jgi:WD40 repeat protein
MVIVGETVVLLWDLVAGKNRAILRLRDGVLPIALAFAPDGCSLAMSGNDNTIRLWNVPEAREWVRLEKQNALFTSLAYSSDGKVLVSGGGDGAVKLAVASSDTISIREVATGKEIVAVRGYSLHVVGMAFNVDGTRLATAGGEDTESGRGGGLRLCDLTTGQDVLSLVGPTDIITHVAFSPDGQRLVSTGAELVIWDASSPATSSADAVHGLRPSD